MDEDGRGTGSGRIVAVALGLLLLAGALSQLVKGALARMPELSDVIADRIELDPLPFGLVPSAGDRQDGEQGYLFLNPEAEPEAEAAETSKSDQRGGWRGRGGGDEQRKEPYDWSAIEIGPEGRPPLELHLTRYGKGATERIEALFEPPRKTDGEVVEVTTFGADGGLAAMDRGRLRWHAYDVAFIHNRRLERGGTFVDLVRVNLSLPGRPLVARVRWPRGYPASKERLVELLEALRPAPGD